MAEEISEDQIEIIHDFIQESREMIEQLEPTIIELGQSCQKVNCWEVMGCPQAECPCHGAEPALSCWLVAGHLGEGSQTCPFTTSPQDCLACQVFRHFNGDRETMNAIFRLFHSMKGSAGFLDLNHISTAAHSAENLLDLIRSGKIEMVPEHVDLLCRACDFAKSALDYLEEHFTDQGVAEEAETITGKLREAIEASKARAEQGGPVKGQGTAGPVIAEAAAAPQSPAAPASSDPDEEVTLDSQLPEETRNFILESDELLQKIDEKLRKWSGPLPAREDMAELSQLVPNLKGKCGLMGMADLESLAEQMELVLLSIQSGATIAEVEPARLLGETSSLLHGGLAHLGGGGDGKISELEKHRQRVSNLLCCRVGDLLLEQGAIDRESLQQALQQQHKPLGTILVEMGKVDQNQVEAALQEQKHRREESKKSAPAAAAKAPAIKRQDLRVDLEKLDALINLIGEIVITENIVLFNPDLRGLELENFNKAGAQLSKLVRELQELAMTIRMIPVSGLFRRMMRLVHDLSVKSGKKVELILNGEETELDKTVIEMITDPLVHLVRNSVDHGLESPEERVAAGKPEKGSVVLSARHKEGEVWITLADDGKGLNREKILAKAISRGLIEGDGSDLSPAALNGLIFQPGFSTADKVTEVSGRGVGLDVVRQNIEKINGRIEINSTPGQGTSFDLRIPLTLGIIDGMLIRVGTSRCIVPMLSIRESFCPSEQMLRTTPDGREIVKVREHFFTVIRLHEILGHEPDSTRLSDGILIMLNYQGDRYCLFVDEILGQQQTVIKSVPDFLGQVRNFSGCTILGDGEVCLILDIVNVISGFEASNPVDHRATLREPSLAEKNEMQPAVAPN